MINCSVIIMLVLHSLQDPHASGLSPFNVQRSRGFGPRLCICFREEGALTLFIATFSVKGLIIATSCKPAWLFHSLYRVTWQLFPGERWSLLPLPLTLSWPGDLLRTAEYKRDACSEPSFPDTVPTCLLFWSKPEPPCEQAQHPGFQGLEEAQLRSAEVQVHKK